MTESIKRARLSLDASPSIRPRDLRTPDGAARRPIRPVRRPTGLRAVADSQSVAVGEGFTLFVR